MLARENRTMAIKATARPGTREHAGDDGDQHCVLQKVQPALLGLMGGTVSVLSPSLAAAGLTYNPRRAFSGLATSVGAGISVGLVEALSDNGKVTGRGNP